MQLTVSSRALQLRKLGWTMRVLFSSSSISLCFYKPVKKSKKSQIQISFSRVLDDSRLEKILAHRNHAYVYNILIQTSNQ